MALITGNAKYVKLWKIFSNFLRMIKWSKLQFLRTRGIDPSIKSTKSTINSTVLYRIQCNIQYNTVQYSTIQYNTVQYSTKQSNTVQNSQIHYKTVQNSTKQCNTVQYSTIQ